MRVVHIRKTEKLLGKEHPSTLTSMNNLAEVLSSIVYDGDSSSALLLVNFDRIIEGRNRE